VAGANSKVATVRTVIRTLSLAYRFQTLVRSKRNRSVSRQTRLDSLSRLQINTPAISLCLSLFFASGMFSAVSMIQGPQVNDFWIQCHYSFRLPEKVYCNFKTELYFLTKPSEQIHTLHLSQEFDLIDVTVNTNLIVYFSLGDSASEVVKSRTNLSSVVIWKDSSCILLSGWYHTWTHSCMSL
jgi:hypothetical protein